MGRNFLNLTQERLRRHIGKTYEIVRLWDSWGIPMKTDGRYYFAGHAYPGGFICLFKYHGRHQKPILYKKGLDSGAVVRNRLTVFDLMCDGEGRIAGAVTGGVCFTRTIIDATKNWNYGRREDWCHDVYPPLNRVSDEQRALVQRKWKEYGLE